jgi:hypothetical protein
MLEELGASVDTLELIGCRENIFVYEGQRGHEVVSCSRRASMTPTSTIVPRFAASRARRTSRSRGCGPSRFATAGRLVPEGLYDLLMERR